MTDSNFNLNEALREAAKLLQDNIVGLYEEDRRRESGNLIDNYSVVVEDTSTGYTIYAYRARYGDYWTRWGYGPTAKTPPGYDYELIGRTASEEPMREIISDGVARDIEALFDQLK